MNEAYKLWHDTKRTVYVSEHSTYSRDTHIQVGITECEICGETTSVMAIDSSDGEYNTFYCCKPCLEKLWEKE